MKENFFSDLYNKLISFFVQEKHSEQSKGSAINRLKTVLAQDRVGFSERAIQMLKDEMLERISKYMEIDEDSFDLQISPKGDATVLELSIPVIRPKTDEEIDEAIEEENERIRQKAQEIVDELKDMVEEHVDELSDDSEESEDDNSDDEVDLDSEEDSNEDEKESDEDAIDDEEERIDEIKENPFEEDNKIKK